MFMFAPLRPLCKFLDVFVREKNWHEEAPREVLAKEDTRSAASTTDDAAKESDARSATTDDVTKESDARSVTTDDITKESDVRSVATDDVAKDSDARNSARSFFSAVTSDCRLTRCSTRFHPSR